MNKQQAGDNAGIGDVPDQFSGIQLRRFVSPGFGVVLNAPHTWREVNSKELFQVVDPVTDTQFTASAFDNPGMSLSQWASSRFSSTAKGLPFLKEIKPSYSIQGVGWSGLAAEYQGTFPGRDYESHYLVLCLRRNNVLISFTITARANVFAANEALFRWLLQNQLNLYQVERTQDVSQGAAEMHKLAEQGDDTAQFSLAALYELGQGVPHDYQMAATWYQRSAEQGNARAQFNLGVYFANGRGVPQDVQQASIWWLKAAEQGHAGAQNYLAKLYEDGMGVPQDHRRAFDWYRLAAEQGEPNAQYRLAYCYVQGLGVARDLDKAAVWASKSAEQGNADAQFYLAIMNENGQGVPRNFPQALTWYRQAAEQGHTEAQSRLAFLAAR